MIKGTQSFTIDLKPKVKGRPRHRTLSNGKTITYTPKETVEFETAVCEAYRAAAEDKGWVPYEGPVAVSLVFNPDSIEVVVWPADHDSKLRGDIDNYAKSTLDGLQCAGFWDDRQVVDLAVRKQ